jgi:hypothetical protein
MVGNAFNNSTLVLQISNESCQTVDKVLNPTIFLRYSLRDHLYLLIVRQSNWQWRRDLLLINHHEGAFLRSQESPGSLVPEPGSLVPEDAKTTFTVLPGDRRPPQWKLGPYSVCTVLKSSGMLSTIGILLCFGWDRHHD